ncbi:MAG: hypothetical protein ACD_2C00073G0022 [uncultured bacterium (gcode 4)]|uniref:Uncharacterized protein n=1 Tax=uncultured bacterium (gcode 4) TaxID=1234023 RepID=K2GHJ6_9BACT|nr:MAG: hypothetical protein ACD_2C00073G0022 [uncultured bacterium (gcode 4)]
MFAMTVAATTHSMYSRGKTGYNNKPYVYLILSCTISAGGFFAKLVTNGIFSFIGTMLLGMIVFYLVSLFVSGWINSMILSRCR